MSPKTKGVMSRSFLKQKRWAVPMICFSFFLILYLALGYPIGPRPLSMPNEIDSPVYNTINKRLDKLNWWESYRYRQALFSFPHLKHCSKAYNVDYQLRVEWNSLNSVQKVEICMMHISEYFGDAKKLVTWLKGQGFSYIHINTNWIKGTRIVAQWPFEHGKSISPFDNLYFRWILESGAKSGATMTIAFDENFSPNSFSIQYSSGF